LEDNSDKKVKNYSKGMNVSHCLYTRHM